MKNLIFIILMSLFVPISTYCSDWVKTNIDTLATIDMPAVPNIINSKTTFISGLRTDSLSFSIVDQFISNYEIDNKNKLESSYSSIIKGMINSRQKGKARLTLVRQSPILFKGLNCMDVEFNIIDSINRTMICRLIFIKNHSLMISSINKSNESEKYKENKDRFFNSLTFKLAISNQSQYGNHIDNSRDLFFQKLGAILFWILFIFAMIKLTKMFWSYMKYNY